MHRPTLIAIALGAAAPAALGGPVWCETGEAGKMLTTAEAPVGVGSIGKIKGMLSGVVLSGGVGTGTGDFVDVYRVYIRFPNLFTATTVNPQSDDPFDTHLWLFDHQGFGLLANDNSVGLGPFSQIGNASDDGTLVTILQPGIYYIAVSGRQHVPVSSNGPIFATAAQTEVSGPDGSGGADPLLDWAGPPLIGNYEIDFTGVGFPPCPGDVNLDGRVDVDDLNIVLSNWADGVAPNTQGDLNGDGFVDVDDLNEVLANWGPTPCLEGGGGG